MATQQTALPTWTLDPVHSSIEFALEFMGMSTYRTGFRALEGTLRFDPDRPAESSVSATIPVASVDVTNDRLMGRLMEDDLLGGANHPSITFRSTRVDVVSPESWKISGELTIHGTSRPVTLDIDGLPQPPGASQSMPLGQGVLVVLREPNTWLLGSYAFLLFGTMTMMQGLWAVPYLMDAYGQTQQQAANALTLWAMGLIVGCTLWGYVADKVVGSHKRVVLAGAVVYGLLWALLAIRPVGLPVGMLWVAMFWGGFFASTWIPSYAQLKDSLPSQIVATAMGILNLFFWLGGAVYQQVSGLILAEFPRWTDTRPSRPIRRCFGCAWVRWGSASSSSP